MVTDGITEALDPGGDLFGTMRGTELARDPARDPGRSEPARLVRIWWPGSGRSASLSSPPTT